MQVRPAGPDMLMPAPPVGYKLIGQYFQAFPPATTTWPKAVIEAIRRDVDPQFVPMWCNYIFRGTDGSVRTEGRVWIWLEARDLPGTPNNWNYYPDSMGINKGRHPNVVFWALEGPKTAWHADKKLPGDYIPIDWWLYHEMKRRKDAYEPDADKVVDRMEEAQRQERDKTIKATRDEAAYRLQQDWKHIKDLAEKVSGPEYDAWLAQKVQAQGEGQ